MDVGAFVQENKRWLLGCALGGVVFWIAHSVIGSINDSAPVVRQALALARPANPDGNELYDRKVLDDVRKESEALQAERQRLVGELGFTHDAAWTDPQGLSLDEFLGKRGRELKSRLQKAAAQRAVDAADPVRWPAPTTVDDQRAALFGLEMVDVATARLWKALDDVRAKDANAPGLASLQFTVEDRRSGRSSMPRLKPGEVDLRDLVEQQRVVFELRGDAAVLQAFLESCRQPDKTLALDALTITAPTRRGEPLTAKGALLGIAFKPKENN